MPEADLANIYVRPARVPCSPNARALKGAVIKLCGW
jgi:hypothetical protein